MRTILYICEKETIEIRQIISFLLEERNQVIVTHSAEEGLRSLRERKDTHLVILVDTPSALKNAETIFSYVEQTNDLITRTPILIVTDENHLDDDLVFLKGEVVDIIQKPVRKEVLINRIYNVLDAYQSVNFNDFANMLRALPSLVYLKDAEGRYVFSSQTWRHLDTGNDPDWTIRGKTDLDIRKDRNNAIIAMKSDQRILDSGKGTSYIIEEKEDGIQEFLQLIKEPLFSDTGKIMGIIALVVNVTEQELMKQQLERQAVIDALTGMYNRDCFERRLREGFSSSDYPIAFITGDCDNLKKVNDTLGHLAGDEWICAGASLMHEGIGEKGELFRTGGDEFVAILRNTDQKECEERIRKMREQASSREICGMPFGISLGCSILYSEEENTLVGLKKSDEDMYRNKQYRKSLNK